MLDSVQATFATAIEDDAWLALCTPDVEFWMPAWHDDDRLVDDPQIEVSRIWHRHHGGLKDWTFPIRTERSSAISLPEPRTLHNISNVEIEERRADWSSYGSAG